jgi:hypothetical protein
VSISITTISIILRKIAELSVTRKPLSFLSCYAECCYYKFVMLSGIILNVVMLNVILPNVMAPFVAFQSNFVERDVNIKCCSINSCCFKEMFFYLQLKSRLAKFIKTLLPKCLFLDISQSG